MSNGSNTDVALAECQAFVLANAHHLKVNPTDLATFVERFRRDFDDVFGQNPKAWETDRIRVTTLARAIGSYAEFLAIADSQGPNEVNYGHLKAAYYVLAPGCKRADVERRREYCVNAAP